MLYMCSNKVSTMQRFMKQLIIVICNAVLASLSGPSRDRLVGRTIVFKICIYI